MSTQISAYRRVASLYKWDYQKAEMALADAMAQLNRLRRTCHKLDAEIDALLESGAGTPAAFDTSMPAPTDTALNLALSCVVRNAEM